MKVASQVCCIKNKDKWELPAVIVLFVVRIKIVNKLCLVSKQNVTILVE